MASVYDITSTLKQINQEWYQAQKRQEADRQHLVEAADALEAEEVRIRQQREQLLADKQAFEDEKRTFKESLTAQVVAEVTASFAGREEALQQTTVKATAELSALRTQITEAATALESVRNELHQRNTELEMERSRLPIDRIMADLKDEVEQTINNAKEAHQSELLSIQAEVAQAKAALGVLTTEITAGRKNLDLLQLDIDAKKNWFMGMDRDALRMREEYENIPAEPATPFAEACLKEHYGKRN